ncbi:putative transcriptional regulator [Waddlia chondrophila 2032/99]|uniref:Putative transcriptional regulator n=2 Tax=Waddlia chondrophila TaxID=71667 RepID=D6YW34_WADCW|nr:response regulator [Waddlia chondrophila]ADI38345.1 putative transcriptional regulator [Waddlia chondrophila WSU 86-1044]CCB91428.1 putative transcriptional regulator [Waddlia chondrophila 2032/99]
MTKQEYRILVVEDHFINLEMISEMLKRLGCIVDTASNGKEALDCVTKNFYDAIFMDLQMPVMDGYETTRLIREDKTRQKIPIIALTANHVKSDLDRCLESGMDGYLTKPFELKDLNNVLKKYLDVASNS